MGYTLQTNNTIFPSQVSFQSIILSSNIQLTWPSYPASGEVAAATFNNINTSQNGYTITLPSARLASNGTDIVFNNISTYSFSILDYVGGDLLTIDPGQVVIFKVYDSSTEAGVWGQIPYGGGTAGIANITLESPDSSITITNGEIAAPGGTVELELPSYLSALGDIKAAGLVALTHITPPYSWKNVEILPGNNITIINGDGVFGDPIISLSDNITDLSSVEVGNITLMGAEISATTTNTDLSLSTSGTGDLDLNGVIVDINSNVTLHNLTITGSFNNSFMPKAWCSFTDTISGKSNIISIEDSANVTSVTGDSGNYVITFAAPLSTDNYGAIISLGSDGGVLPQVRHGFSVVKQVSSLEIVIVDASGELVSDAPYGVTVMVLCST